MKITALNWTAQTDRDIAQAAGADLPLIRDQVKAGEADLYRLESDQTDLLVVARGESTVTGKELVIVCVQGRGMKDAGPALIEAAKQQEFESIRYHCENPAVQRLYQRYGFAGYEAERVYKIEVGG